MARLTWTDGAIADLEHIRRYVTAFHVTAARRLAWRIADAATALEGERPDPSGAIRERPIVRPFVIRYRWVGDGIVVMAIRHGSGALIT